MAYAFKRTITCDHTQCGSSDSTNFPVLVVFTDVTMKLVSNGGHINNTTTSNGQTVCADLAFYSDSALTTKLNWEIEFYDGTAGTVIAWVQVGTLSHTSDTVFYMAYDDASVTTFQGNVNGTWPSSAVAVWHFPNGATLGTNDSTSQANTLSVNGTVTAATGHIDGGAQALAGSNYLSDGSPSGLNLGAVFTLSQWINLSTVPGANAFQGVVRANPSSQGIYVHGDNGGVPRIEYYGVTFFVGIPVIVTTSTWYLAHFTSTGSLVTGYLNGVLEVTDSTHTPSFDASTTVYAVGDQFSQPLLGIMDEARIYNAPLSADWITSEYNNQKTSSTFLTVGSETPVSGSFTTGRSYFL